jgi:hypothetical protein
MTLLHDRAAAAVAALSEVSMDVAAYRQLTETDLLDLTRVLAEAERLAAGRLAVATAEISRRSAPQLGHSGLAQKHGLRTAVELVRAMTGSTARDATAAIRAGQLVHDVAALPDPRTGEIALGDSPWLRSVGLALGSGVSVAAAEAIKNGLGRPSLSVSEQALSTAAEKLCAAAATLDADRLYQRARQLRDELDAGGIADREAERRERRAFRFRKLPDGMARVVWDLDPESAASVGELYDRATSPRRGGPRFADPLADRILTDERTTQQLASDVFVQLLRAGADADSSQLLGTGAPVVNIFVTAEATAARQGHGRIEGAADPISIETVERLSCAGVTVPVLFDGEDVLNLGRTQRLFTPRQRAALAARDGGCRMPTCDRPPSWTEAHHIEHWERDGGATDLVNGILLCRHHHLLLHNNGWEISRRDKQYWLIPPPDVDSARTPVAMPVKSAALLRCDRRAAG